MRAYIIKAVAVLSLTAFFGIPFGFYMEQAREDARTMTQEQWLEFMKYTQMSYENHAGFIAALFTTLVICAGLVCIYEFAKLVSGKLIDRVLGPQKRREPDPFKPLY